MNASIRSRDDRLVTQEAPQVVAELARRRISVFASLREGLLADDREVSRNAGIDAIESRWLDRQHRVRRLPRILAVERTAQREQLVEHDAEREHIGPAVDLARLAAKLLGTHVA